MKIIKDVCTILLVSIFFIVPELSFAASPLFSDNFESYVTGIGLAGQGGWYQSSRFQAPIILSAGNGLSSTVVNGGIRTGDLQYIDANIASVQHSLPKPLSLTSISTFSVDSYAFTAYRSHGSGPYLASRDFTTSVGWYAAWYNTVDREQSKWQFYTPSGSEIFHGGFDQPVHLEVIIDGSAGTAYGRLTHSGGVYETNHYPITPAQIAALTEVALTEDFRDSFYVGVEYDNVEVAVGKRNTPPPPPDLICALKRVGDRSWYECNQQQVSQTADFGQRLSDLNVIRNIVVWQFDRDALGADPGEAYYVNDLRSGHPLGIRQLTQETQTFGRLSDFLIHSQKVATWQLTEDARLGEGSAYYAACLVGTDTNFRQLTPQKTSFGSSIRKFTVNGDTAQWEFCQGNVGTTCRSESASLPTCPLP